MIYLDHAATSFPKAPGVGAELARFAQEDAGNPGRGGHSLARRAAEALQRARQGLALLLGIGDAERLALMPGATTALNVALHGLLAEGDRVLVGPEAHNSILRPLHVLGERRSVQVEEVACDEVLRWDLSDLEARLSSSGTKLVVVSHGSNVTGVVQDLAEITRLAHAAGAQVLVDGAQTVGGLPLDVSALEVDLLAFSGHKALLGPTGTGGLYVRAGIELPPLITGGTGTRSEEEAPPVRMPSSLEAGTSNAMGFAGLAVAVAHVRERTPAAIHAHTAALGARLRAGLAELGAVVYAGARPEDMPVVSFTLPDWDPHELATVLDGMGVAARAGLHCAPRAHRRLGTLPAGTIRLSPGPDASLEAVEEALAAVAGVL